MAEETNNMNEESLEEPLTPEEAKGPSEGNDTGAEEKKKKIKKILLILLPIILVIAASSYFFLFVIKEQKNSIDKHVQESNQEDIKLDSNTYLDVDPITVSLSPIAGGKKEYLRLDITLRLANDKENEVILAKMPIIKDSLITFLRSLRSSDFNSSSSTLYLKEEITKRINKITAPIIVKEVMFQEISIN